MSLIRYVRMSYIDEVDVCLKLGLQNKPLPNVVLMLILRLKQHCSPDNWSTIVQMLYKWFTFTG